MPVQPWYLDPARRRITLGILASAVILIAFAVWFKVRQANGFSSERALLGRLPNEPAAVLSLDFSTLRRAGLLKPHTAAVEPDYKAFVEGTGFDYRRDLDLLVASLSQHGNYFIARGRFNWEKLRAYAFSHGGSCYDQLCRAPGSAPGRRISFLPLRRDVMALAVTGDDLAATRLSQPSQPIVQAIPDAPVWMSIPGSALASPGALPEGMRVALSGILDADRVLITASGGAGGIEAHLDARCRSLDGARILESQLRSLAATLKDDLKGNRNGSDGALAGLLSAGSFQRDATRVTGTWRINPALIQELTAGI